MGVQYNKKFIDELVEEILEVVKQTCEGNDEYFTAQQLTPAIRQRLDSAPNDKYGNKSLSDADATKRIGTILSNRYAGGDKRILRVRNEFKRNGATYSYRVEA